MKRLECIGLGKLEEMQNFDEGFIVCTLIKRLVSYIWKFGRHRLQRYTCDERLPNTVYGKYANVY
jgi:hypothetical protein